MTNVAVLVGNLVRDPEIRQTNTGKSVAAFTIAVNEGFGEKRTASFIRCEAWEPLTESLTKAHKGSRLVVEGKIAVDSWTDRDGKRQERMKVVAKTIGVSEPRSTEARSETLDLSDIPF